MTHPTPSPFGQPPSIYDLIGPAPFASLARLHYAGIDGDPRLRAMFPADLSATSPSVRDMQEFLTQFFGGPAAYSERKGHPRLRARHAPFTITQAARDAWLEHALAALDATVIEHALDEHCAAQIREYLIRTSQFMINA